MIVGTGMRIVATGYSHHGLVMFEISNRNSSGKGGGLCFIGSIGRRRFAMAMVSAMSAISAMSESD